MLKKIYLIVSIITLSVIGQLQGLPESVDPSTLCFPPDNLAHGIIIPLREYYHIGHAIDFECVDGYELEGITWTVCVYNTTLKMAHWHFDIPHCKRKLLHDTTKLLFSKKQSSLTTKNCMHA